jgi:hypothetical protein
MAPPPENPATCVGMLFAIAAANARLCRLAVDALATDDRFDALSLRVESPGFPSFGPQLNNDVLFAKQWRTLRGQSSSRASDASQKGSLIAAGMKYPLVDQVDVTQDWRRIRQECRRRHVNERRRDPPRREERRHDAPRLG